MKRILLSLFILSFCLTMTANDDVHLQRLVQCVNDSDFNCALEELPLVEDWSFDVDSIYIQASYLESLVSYIDLTYKDHVLLDSLKEKVYNLCHNYVEQYYGRGLYTKTIPYQIINAILAKSIYGEQSSQYAAMAHNLGLIYYKLRELQSAKEYTLEAVRLRKQIYGVENEMYIRSLNNLGLVYEELGEYSNAEKCHLEASVFRENAYGRESEKYAASLNNLGLLYHKMSLFSKAENCFLESAKIRKSIKGEGIEYASSLNNLGRLYVAKGDYLLAEEYLQKSINLKKSILGDAHPELARTLTNLASLYDNIRDYEKAEEIFLEVLQIHENSFATHRPAYASALTGLGNVYLAKRDFISAEKCFFEALDIEEALLGKTNPSYSMLISDIGVMYYEKGDYSKALHYYQETLNLQQSIFGTQSLYVANILNNIGLVYSHLGNCDAAENFYKRSMIVRKTILGEESIDYAESLQNIGVLYQRKEDYGGAGVYQISSQRIYKKYYLGSLGFMTESQRKNYWDRFSTFYEKSYPKTSFCGYPANHNISTFAYDNELFIKGLLLNSSNAVKRSILESNDTTLIAQWNDLMTKKRQIIVLEEKDPKSEYVAQLRDEAEVLEKAITKSSAAYRENQRQWTITWDSVRNVLQPNQVAIEYMVAPLNDDSTMYCALLVRDTCTYPILIPLFEEKEVTDLLDNSTASSINETYAYAGNGKQLSRLIWGKVLRYIQPGEVVFFAPTGLLHQVAMESLPNDASGTINDVYNLVRLSSTRELVLNKPAIPHQDAALYGGIFYEPMDSVKLRRISEKYRPAKRSTPSLANDTTQRSMAEYLPGTKEEIEAIRPILEHQMISVQVHSKNDACEESFKALSGQKQNVLHLATHGFYWTDTTWSPDPMDRCGLLFAGANTALSGHSERLPEGADDGILTAKEISVLDFRGADIVVMSACETGLGDISGEGVFGLQRAFKMAGAQSLLMAIWSVNDRATQMLMTAFHRYMGEGHTKREAFRMAQQDVRSYEVVEERSSKGHSPTKDKYKNKGKNVAPQDEDTEPIIETIITHPYQSPYYWAGFILLD